MATGQARLLWARRPIERVIADPATPPLLRDQLEQVRAVRSFAESLGLSVHGRYRHYTPWPGDRVVTTIVSTQPGEIEPAGFWFPIVGRVPYKGYFDQARASAEAERLRRSGHDVCEVSVRAYSTLGWFDDPVTGPMLRLPEGQLVETLIHELLHVTVFLASRPGFNEGVASFVGEEGRVRFFAASEGAAAADRERARVSDRRRVRSELLWLRNAVESLYRGERPGDERARLRADLEREARRRLAALPLRDRNPSELAASVRLNDACLALTATYAADTDCYARALEALGGDLSDFVSRVRDAADAEEPRVALLRDTSCEDIGEPAQVSWVEPGSMQEAGFEDS